jgi:hypothetical protein
MKVWDAATGQEILTLKGHTGWVHIGECICVQWEGSGDGTLPGRST